MVPRAGVEPARPRTRDFKSLASTNFAIGAVALKSREYIGLHSMKQARKILKKDKILAGADQSGVIFQASSTWRRKGAVRLALTALTASGVPAATI